MLLSMCNELRSLDVFMTPSLAIYAPARSTAADTLHCDAVVHCVLQTCLGSPGDSEGCWLPGPQLNANDWRQAYAF